MGFDDDESGSLQHRLERRRWPPVRLHHCVVERLDGVCRIEVAQQQGAARPQDPRELSNRRGDARRVVVDGGEPRQDAAEFVVRLFDCLDAALVESHAGIGCARVLDEVRDEIDAPDGEAEPGEMVGPVPWAASGIEDRAVDGLCPGFDEVQVTAVNGIHRADHMRILGGSGRVRGGHIEHFLRLPARKARVVDTVGHVQDAAEWTLRPREDRDLEKIVGWIPDAEALRLFSGTRLSWPLTVRQLQEVTEASALAPSVVVAASGELVGHFDLRLEERAAWLGRVVVDPSLRGQGLARGVVELAVGEAHRLGAHRVRLNVISSNVPAVRTYRRVGFLAQPPEDARTDVTVMERTCVEDGFGSRVLVTGMSGAGKSTVLRCLSGRGYRTLDTDYDEWVLGDGRWDESRMAELLASEKRIAVSGTVENQMSFYDRFEHVVLLSAPVEVLLERLHSRTDNPYGRSSRDREEVRRYVAEVEPLLRAGADVELDARRPVDELADEIELLLAERRRRIPRGP